jgi:hypothetical protein
VHHLAVDQNVTGSLEDLMQKHPIDQETSLDQASILRSVGRQPLPVRRQGIPPFLSVSRVGNFSVRRIASFSRYVA